MELSPSFCVLPWMHVFADESGVLWPCCRVVGSRRPNVDDRSGEPLRIDGQGGILRAMDSAYMRALRRQMLDGARPAACARCYMVEDLGMQSHRQTQNAEWSNAIPPLLAATGQDGALQADVLSADLRLGNTCNLRCRMCSPHSSHALIPEWAAFHGVARNSRHMAAFHHPEWFAQSAFWSMLEREAPHLERVHFAGGEPFLIEGMFDYLERVAESGRSRRLVLSYNTNLTLIPPRIFHLWPAFKAVRVTVSIDGYDTLNDFIRYPSAWTRLDANLRLLDTRADELNLGAGLATNSAVQAYNVFRLGELLDYLATALTRFEVPNLAILSQPEHLGIRVLPSELKALATRQLRAAVARSQSLWRQRWGDVGATALVNALEGVVTHMNESDRSTALPRFLRWSQHLDQSRGQDTATVIPELRTLFSAAAPASSLDPRRLLN